MSDTSDVYNYMHWTSGCHPVRRTNERTMNWNVIQRLQLLRRGNYNANRFGHFMGWRFLPSFFSVTSDVCQGEFLVLNYLCFILMDYVLDGLWRSGADCNITDLFDGVIMYAEFPSSAWLIWYFLLMSFRPYLCRQHWSLRLKNWIEPGPVFSSSTWPLLNLIKSNVSFPQLDRKSQTRLEFFSS